MMSKIFLAVSAAVALLVAAAPAQAHVSFSFGVYGPPPVYYEPPPVYYEPPPVYYSPPPAYYGPPAVVYSTAPRYYTPAYRPNPGYYGPRDRWQPAYEPRGYDRGDHHEHRGHHDDDD